jgi:DNA modification methylase
MFIIHDDTIYCGNCVDIMSEMAPDCIDLVVTSPPYDDLREYDGYVFDVDLIAKGLYRVMKPGGVVVWVVGDKVYKGGESLTSFKHALSFQSAGFSIMTMIYKKAGVAHPTKHHYNRIFEYMFTFIKGGKPRVFNSIKDHKNKWAGHSNWGDITTRKKDGSLKLQKTKEENTYVIPEYGKRDNIWEYATGKGNTTRDIEAYEHPAMFPENLVKDHILSWTNEGDTILDPMCGAGTTLKMAKILGRKYIGIDSSQRYCDIAQRRVDKY